MSPHPGAVPGPRRPVVATGAGDRVEVAVVAGGLERGEHGGVVPTTGVVPGIDRARASNENVLSDTTTGAPAASLSWHSSLVGRNRDQRASNTSSASAASAPRVAIAPSSAPTASTSTSVPMARKRAGDASSAPFTAQQYETP